MQSRDPQSGAVYATRRERRSAVRSMLACLKAIRDAEQNSLGNVPESFQNSVPYEIGEHAVEILDDIIDLMADIY